MTGDQMILLGAVLIGLGVLLLAVGTILLWTIGKEIGRRGR